MITGFNTDIVFQGVTYHVQTEDKGVDTPLILSLVYDRGTILASKRSPYDDLLKSNFSEKELAERLQRQHKLICAAVRAGRLDDLKQMTMKEAAAKRKSKEAKTAVETAPPTPVQVSVKPSTQHIKLQPIARIQSPVVEPPVKTEPNVEDVPAPKILNTPIPPPVEPPPAVANFSTGNGDLAQVIDNEIWEIPISVLDDLIVDDEIEYVGEVEILPAEAVAMIHDYQDHAATEPDDDTLKVDLLNEVSFKSGERKTLSVLVKRGSKQNGLSGAHVMVKILGTSFRPQVFHAKTDSNGIAVIQLQLPRFTRGRAAVLIRAMSGGEETELRKVIAQD